jgi:signal transduction histidine kinase
MSYPILTTRITPASLVAVRDRARQVADTFGLEKLHGTRFITAVSEVARNAVQHAGGGNVAFYFREGRDRDMPQHLVAVVTDKGPGIKDIEAALAGAPRADGHRPMGLVGTRRLADEIGIECPPGGGTVVTLGVALPRTAPRLSSTDLGVRVDRLSRQKPRTPVEELENQNREMLAALEELALRKQELEKADLRKNQFLATLAHELRSPLGTLHMTLEILKRSPDITPGELAKRRDAMARQTDQLTKLVEDLMDVSRVSQGKVELDRHRLELHELVNQALEMSGAVIAAKAHRVTVRRNDDDLWVTGDATRLRQVLGNLLGNAARYTPAEGDITVTLRRNLRLAEIEVADNGMGIGADMLPHVFDLFVQGDNPSKTDAGLGVGLTLVRRLVEAHGGEVAVSSDGAGQGARVTVTLPLA